MRQERDATTARKSAGARPGRTPRAELELRKRAATRLNLIRAGIAVFGRRAGGLSTIDEVNAAAGVARGTFYNYFTTREELVATLAYELTKDFNDAIIASLDGVEDAAVRTSVGVRHYVVKAMQDRVWGWATVNIAMNGQMLGADTVRHIADTVGRGIRSGRLEVEDDEAAIDLKVGAMLTAMLTVLGTGADHERYLTGMMVMLLRGLGLPDREARRIASAPLPRLDVRDGGAGRSLEAVGQARGSRKQPERRIAVFTGRITLADPTG